MNVPKRRWRRVSARLSTVPRNTDHRLQFVGLLPPSQSLERMSALLQPNPQRHALPYQSVDLNLDLTVLRFLDLGWELNRTKTRIIIAPGFKK